MTVVKMIFGDAELLAELNGTETARAFARRLPRRIHLGDSGSCFCGQLPFTLPYEDAQVHHGWTDGDVSYSPGAGWLSVMLRGQERSRRYGNQVVLGRLTAAGLSRARELSGSFDVLVELADQPAGPDVPPPASGARRAAGTEGAGNGRQWKAAERENHSR